MLNSLTRPNCCINHIFAFFFLLTAFWRWTTGFWVEIQQNITFSVPMNTELLTLTQTNNKQRSAVYMVYNQQCSSLKCTHTHTHTQFTPLRRVWGLGSVHRECPLDVAVCMAFWPITGESSLFFNVLRKNKQLDIVWIYQQCHTRAHARASTVYLQNPSLFIFSITRIMIIDTAAAIAK